MVLIEPLLLTLALLSSSTALAAALVAVVHYRRRPPPTDEALAQAFPHGLPKVTVLKPCKGADPALYDNLASFLRLDGVPYELLIGIADPKDPAVAIAQKLVRDFPGRDVRVVITGDREGFNPKVMNLSHLAAHATGELFYVADSNVRVSPGLLRKLVLPFRDSKVALSYAMFRGVPGKALGARIQATIFCTLGLPSIAAAYRLFGIGNLVGKSFILRRSALDRMGGFAHYERYLVEDGLIGRDIRRHGYKAVLANEAVDVHLGEMSVPFMWAQEMRWAVLHKLAFWTLPVGELIWNPFFLALASGGAFLGGLELAGWMLLAAAVHNQVIDVIPFVLFGNRLRDAWLLVLADLTMFLVVNLAWFHRDVVWRGQRFTLGKDTLILKAQPAAGAQVHVLPVRSIQSEPIRQRAGSER